MTFKTNTARARCAVFVSSALALAMVPGAQAAPITDTEQKLTASDGAANDFFGYSVGVSGNTAIVGAYADDDNGSFSGSAYLFDATTGAQTAKLTASDGERDDEFGRSVAISGNTAIVGAPLDDDRGSDSGSAYLFDATTGAQTAKLTTFFGRAGDNLGSSVGVSGNTAIVGGVSDENNGTAYLFDATTGQETAILTGSGGRSGDQFGFSVGVSENTAIVGAPLDDDNGSLSGSAYLFDATTGEQLAKLTAPDGEAGDQFGYSVAISGNTAIVGAFGDDDNGSLSGSAYVFDLSGLFDGNDLTGVKFIEKLVASDGEGSDRFGRSVAIAADSAIVGALGDDDNGGSSGSAYLYDTSGMGSVDPVPLPAAAWMMLAGLGGVIGLGRKSKRSVS